MDVPDISKLNILGVDQGPTIPDDIANATDDPKLVKLKNFARLLPYSIESNAEMQRRLECIMLQITRCVEAKDYNPGLIQWDIVLCYWALLEYPIPRDKRIRLIKLYYHLCTAPGMPAYVVQPCSTTILNVFDTKKLTIEDMRLPWKPLFDLIHNDLFLKRREVVMSPIPKILGTLVEFSRRFFHPAAIDDMLETFVPLINGNNLNDILASQFYLLGFLPLSHPQSYLPFLFRLWEPINSWAYDNRMVEFLCDLAKTHLDPQVSNPSRISEIPDDARSADEKRPNWSKDDLVVEGEWQGIYRDVGIFSEQEWEYIMCKCLASMAISLADAGSATTSYEVDQNKMSSTLEQQLPAPPVRAWSFARLIVYSMAQDGPTIPPSDTTTPLDTPPGHDKDTKLNNLGEYLSASAGAGSTSKPRTYVAGSKALDSLVKLVASCENFFHPNNSGSWTYNLANFVRYVASEFQKRWHEEMLPECKTPMDRRLTLDMKRELVKSIRTVALLSLFCEDENVVGFIKDCLRTLSMMEPDLILHPILERAVPSLESLTEYHRTIPLTKALGAVTDSMACRKLYYAGAKHLLPILELLLPGIDLNDSDKTLATTAVLEGIVRRITFGDVQNKQGPVVDLDTGLQSVHLPRLEINDMPEGVEAGSDTILSNKEEDAILKNMCGQFADWVAAFVRRAILLFENLPENDPEDGLVNAVCNVLSTLCLHLSAPLYDMVLKMVFDYLSSNTAPGALNAIYQLVVSVARAEPTKAMAKLLPYCIANVHSELDRGASSQRTTSWQSTPLLSDATLHWNLTIIRGVIFGGSAILNHKADLLKLFQRLLSDAYAEKTFSISADIVSNTITALTVAYTFANRVVNPDEWESETFQREHYRHWGRLYRLEDTHISWYRPQDAEIDFAVVIYREVVEKALDTFDQLLDAGNLDDTVWRNGFCRNLSFIRSAFCQIFYFVRDVMEPEELRIAHVTSDTRHEIPEMLAAIDPVVAPWALSDPTDPRHRYILGLRTRLGGLLHKASITLRRDDGDAIDTIQLLISTIRTYLIACGPEMNEAVQMLQTSSEFTDDSRQFLRQKELNRAVWARRATTHNAFRQSLNYLKRRRGLLEDQLIDDLAEWSLWHYATNYSSQGVGAPTDSESSSDYFSYSSSSSSKDSPATNSKSRLEPTSRLTDSPSTYKTPTHFKSHSSRQTVQAGDLHSSAHPSETFHALSRSKSAIYTPQLGRRDSNATTSDGETDGMQLHPAEEFDLRDEVMSCIAKSIGLLQPPLSGEESVEASPAFTPSEGGRSRNGLFKPSFGSLSMLEYGDDESSMTGSTSSTMNDGYMSGLDNEVEILFFPAGSTLAKAGETNTGLFYVIDGFLDILLPVEAKSDVPRPKPSKPTHPASGSSRSSSTHSDNHMPGFSVHTAPRPREEDPKPLFTVKAGGIAGYLSSLCNTPSYVDIKAKTDTYVGFLPSNALDRLLEKRPIVLLTLAKRLISLLSPLILHIDGSLDWVQVNAGQVLWRPDDVSDSFYIVINGRLRAINEKEGGGITIEAEYGQGDTVGELDVIISSPRSNTVHAIRDTELIRMPQTLFNAISSRNPQTTAQLLKMIASRVKDEAKSSARGLPSEVSRSNINLKTVAILPATRNVPVDAFSRKLHAALESIGAPTSYLNQSSVANHLGRHAFTRMGKLKAAGWLAEQEQKFRIVLYVADSTVNSAWTQTCIRQADCVMVIGMGEDPSLGEYERLLLSMKTTARKELVLLHPDRSVVPGSTREWLKNRPWVHQHIHVELPGLMVPVTRAPQAQDPAAVAALKNLKDRVQSGIQRYRGGSTGVRPQRGPHTSDFARLARRICGKTIGLVLGGGGARGISHLGVIRALEEYGIPIDHVGGTSIGALVGGLYAREGDLLSAVGRAKQFSGRMGNIWRTLSDVTYPIVAYTTGHEFNRSIYKAFYDLHIEDMWLPYFCNSTNINTSTMEIHETGYAWRFIRASMTLVGLLPPLCDNGNMLVDGGYIDNLPVAAMMSLGASAVIASDVGSLDDNSPRNFGDSVSGWWLLINRWNPFSNARSVPAITEIQSRLAYVSSVNTLEEAKVARGCLYMQMPVHEYGTLQFGKFEEIHEKGYSAALELLEKFDYDGRLPSAFVGDRKIRLPGKSRGRSARRNSI